MRTVTRPVGVEPLRYVEASTAVQADTYELALERALEQFRGYYGDINFTIKDLHATAVGTVAGQILTWDVVFHAST